MQQTKQDARTSLQLESLENRMMLSTVSIFAAGGAGDEAFELKIDDVVVETFTNVGGDASAREFNEFIFETSETITADQVRVEFINDAFDAETGFDRNLFVDRIEIDGTTFETESPSVFSTGFIDGSEFTGPGFLENETLNVNGSFFFSEEGATPELRRVRIDARGTEGGEIIVLEQNGVQLETFTLSTETQSFFFETTEDIELREIGVRFINDQFDPARDFDRNVVLESVQVIDDSTGERDIVRPALNPHVYSTGTFTDADGIVPGFGRGNVLNANGVFRFAGPDTLIVTPIAAASASDADDSAVDLTSLVESQVVLLTDDEEDSVGGV